MMKVSDNIKYSLEASDRKDYEQAMLHVCLAIDGSAAKAYPELSGAGKVGERYKKFINDNLDIIELMFGGINLKETLFPFTSNKGRIGLGFAEIIYEKFRCNLAHGQELPDGYGINVQLSDGVEQCKIDILNKSILLPQSTIYALGIICELCPKNADQCIGSNFFIIRIQ